MMHYEKSLAIARDSGFRETEANALDSLANVMFSLSQTIGTIEYYEQALTIKQEIGDPKGECVTLHNLGFAYQELGQIEIARRYYQRSHEIANDIGYDLVKAGALTGLGNLLMREELRPEALSLYEEAVRLADQMSNAQFQVEARLSLAWALLRMGHLQRARIAIKEASQYDFPMYSPKVRALHGIIVLRQSEIGAAREAFQEAVVQADHLLRLAERNSEALYAKALGHAGLALCKDAGLVSEAAEAYRKARAINSNPGIVKDALQDLDALMKADPTGLLVPVRAAAAGQT